jgi:hypothetical protein
LSDRPRYYEAISHWLCFAAAHRALPPPANGNAPRQGASIDAGGPCYFSAANVRACVPAKIEPLIAMGRQPHYPPLAERFTAAPTDPENPTPVEATAYRQKTLDGRKLYALSKQMPEPVFGIIKLELGFRQFLLRGPECVHTEWSLVTMAWNIKRMFALRPAR